MKCGSTFVPVHRLVLIETRRLRISLGDQMLSLRNARLILSAGTTLWTLCEMVGLMVGTSFASSRLNS